MSKTKEPEFDPLPNLLIIDSDTEKLLCKSISSYNGQLDVLESALGSLIISQQFGSKVLFMVHSRTTVNKYQKILGLKFSDISEPIGPLAMKCRGMRLIKTAGSYWEIVKNKVKVERKNHADK
ncbi:MAG: hypothetical protein JKY88_16805 [Pseudomonadales bacterium]|nr:hypothetical protein [Pseudomonadales bacterium]